MKILVAEDDPVTQDILRLTFERAGHAVIVVPNGALAWARFQADPVSVIVSDWVMPEMDGLELCRRVRASTDADYTYFLLLTALPDGKENYRSAIEAGIDDFLTKPLDRDVILLRLTVAERILGFTAGLPQLSQLLPMCGYCKRIRDEKERWQDLQSYIHTHTRSKITHAICPPCLEKQMQDLSQADVSEIKSWFRS